MKGIVLTALIMLITCGTATIVGMVNMFTSGMTLKAGYLWVVVSLLAALSAGVLLNGGLTGFIQ